MLNSKREKRGLYIKKGRVLEKGITQSYSEIRNMNGDISGFDLSIKGYMKRNLKNRKGRGKTTPKQLKNRDNEGRRIRPNEK